MKRVTDKQRLDWLEKSGDFGVLYDSCGLDKDYNFSVAGKPSDEWHPTLRRAIDDAIRTSRKGRVK